MTRTNRARIVPERIGAFYLLLLTALLGMLVLASIHDLLMLFLGLELLTFSLYIMAGFDGFPELMEKLGKHKTGKSCLYIKKLEDIHLPTLKKLVKQSIKHVKATNKG